MEAFFQNIGQWFVDVGTSIGDSFYRNLIREDRWLELLKGLGVTLEIALFALIIGTVIGVILALMRTSQSRLLQGIAGFYVTVVRGIPLVTQLLIIYFIVFAKISIDGVWVAIIAFGINSGGYMCEILRSGIQAVDRGQLEAGRSLGLNYWQSMFSIVLPQAVKNVLPAYTNEFVVLIKETAIVGYIAVEDLTKVADIIRSRTFDAFFPLFTAAAIYLVVTLFFAKMFRLLERRLARSDRG